MKYRIPNVLGYHGFELQNYRTLGAQDEGWKNLGSPNLFSLLSIRFLILDRADTIPGFHQVVGPTATPFGTTAVLFEQDTVPPYARVVMSAAKVPDAQIVPTLVDARFPVNSVVLLPDTSTAQVAPAQQPFPQSAARATVAAWAPGRMTVNIAGADPSAGHLLVSENWYPDWHATVDGKPGVVRRADQSLISVDLPAGAKTVELVFDSPTYAKGKMVSLAGLLFATLMTIVPLVLMRRRAT
jgi:hypothetical protein